MMEQDNVVRPVHFKRAVAPEQLAQLREDGVLEPTSKTLDALKLPEPAYGEMTIGELTPAETEIFLNWYEAKGAFKTAAQEHMGDSLHKLGDAVKRGDDDKFALGDQLHPQEMKDLFRLQRRHGYLTEMLFWIVSERLDMHDYVIGFRSKGRIVRGNRKY